MVLEHCQMRVSCTRRMRASWATGLAPEIEPDGCSWIAIVDPRATTETRTAGRMSRDSWNFGDGPVVDQATA